MIFNSHVKKCAKVTIRFDNSDLTETNQGQVILLMIKWNLVTDVEIHWWSPSDGKTFPQREQN